MSTFDDSSFEMHDDSLTPDTAERLLDGEITSPEFADLAAMVNDVRTMASATPTPAVRGALAEYVGVGLTATELPAESPATAAVSDTVDLTTADQPRRRSVIAEAMTFAGTLTGKVLLGGAVAAASVTGAQAAGVVDLPGFTDKPATLVVADHSVDEAPAELPLQDASDEAAFVEPEPAEDKPVQDDAAPEVDEASIDEAVSKANDEAKDDEPEEPKEEEDKPEEPKDDKPKEDKPKEDKPKEEQPKDEDAIDALHTQLLIDKEAVYAAANVLIEPLKAEKKPLVEALNATLKELKTARNDAKAPLYAELETVEDEERKAEIEAELSAIFEQWELDRDAAIAAASPAIHAIEVQIENIEIERDAEITRLLEQYEADVDALGG